VNTQLELGEARKTHGIEAVQEIGTDFAVKVDNAIRLLARGSEPFSANEVRHLAQVEPHHPNAWGARFSKAAKEGLIQRVGFTKASTPSRHASMVSTWEGVR
jgi:hypothetical protein